MKSITSSKKGKEPKAKPEQMEVKLWLDSSRHFRIRLRGNPMLMAQGFAELAQTVPVLKDVLKVAHKLCEDMDAKEAKAIAEAGPTPANQIN